MAERLPQTERSASRPIRCLGKVKSYVTIHIDASGFRQAQNDEDRFDLYFGGDPFWLTREEVEAFRNLLGCALQAHDAAYARLPGATPQDSRS